MISNQDIADAIRGLRDKLDLTQEELAFALKLSVAAIQKYEGGVNRPARRNLAKFRDMALANKLLLLAGKFGAALNSDEQKEPTPIEEVLKAAFNLDLTIHSVSTGNIHVLTLEEYTALIELADKAVEVARGILERVKSSEAKN